MYSDMVSYVESCTQIRVRKLKKVVWLNVVPVCLMWVTLKIFECVAVESNERIHFHMRIHITEIMSIIIVVVIAYRPTHPFFEP